MTVAVLLAAGLTGCTHVPVAPSAVVAPPVAPPAVPPAQNPKSTPAPSPPAASAPGPTANRTRTPAPVQAPKVATTPKPAPAPAPVPPPAATSAVVTRPAVPALDLGSLEQKLRDTKAIGVFTKLSLKNQVDDLLARFRDFYAKKSTATLADLRQKYDLLLLKVLERIAGRRSGTGGNHLHLARKHLGDPCGSAEIRHTLKVSHWRHHEPP